MSKVAKNIKSNTIIGWVVIVVERKVRHLTLFLSDVNHEKHTFVFLSN